MATKKQKEFWYVLVLTETGPTFVTSLGEGKTAYWNKSEKPYEFSKAWAKDLCIGLTWNGYTSFTVCSPFEIDRQPYLYEKGHFEWVSGSEEET